MTRTLLHSLSLGLLLTLQPRFVGGQGEKLPDIKEIMGKLNKPTGVYYSLSRELKEDEPMWDEAKQQSKLLAQLAAALPRNAPPKGDKASWDALAKTYTDNARAVNLAVQKMDKAAAQTALRKMGGDACMICHKAHRP